MGRVENTQIFEDSSELMRNHPRLKSDYNFFKVTAQKELK